MQIDPRLTRVGPPRSLRFKLKYDESLSRFGFNSNLRHYSLVGRRVAAETKHDGVTAAGFSGAGAGAAGGGGDGDGTGGRAAQ